MSLADQLTQPVSQIVASDYGDARVSQARLIKDAPNGHRTATHIHSARICNDLQLRLFTHVRRDSFEHVDEVGRVPLLRITPALVKKAITPRTKAVIVNTPSNPTGSVIDPDDLLAIGRLARRHGFLLFYDDTYANLSFDGAAQPLQRLRDEIGDKLVVLGTSSKSYCMTGWRIGWLLGARPLADAVTALISHSTQCPNSFAQRGAVAALTGPQGFVAELREEYRRRRDFIHGALSAIPGVACVKPAGSFYVFPNVKRFLGGGRSSLELAMALLDEQQVATVPGEGFAAPGYVRLSFARSMEELKEGAARIRQFLQHWNGGAA